MVLLQVLITALLMGKLSAGVGLFWAVSSNVSAVQTFVLGHEQRRLAGALA